MHDIRGRVSRGWDTEKHVAAAFVFGTVVITHTIVAVGSNVPGNSEATTKPMF